MEFDILFLGLTFGITGKVLLGIAVVMVHSRIVTEHRIDRVVITEMRKERNVAILGIVFMIIGYLLELVFFGFLPVIEAIIF